MAIPLLLFVVAIAARLIVASVWVDPAYPDAYYYANVAREIAAGNGFQVGYIWNFVEVGGRLPAVGELPIPSNAHWMPLAAVLQVPFIWLLGPTATASGLPFWLAAAATAPITYLIGRDARLPRWQATLAGLLVAVPGAITPYLGQPDNFGLFMLLGALALWLCARGIRGDRRSFALGGLVVGLAFLARNDGVLLAVPFVLAFAADALRPPPDRVIGWRSAAGAALLCLLVTAPWLLRQLDVFGSISPSSAGGRILFIREYHELYGTSSETTLTSFLSQGPVALLTGRVGGLASALAIFAVMPMVVVLVPVLVVGAWQRRRDAAFRPWLAYLVALFTFSAIVSAVHVPYGTFIHSAVALLPHAYLLSLVGLAALIGWIAAHRPAWDAQRATRNISVIVVASVLVISVAATAMTIHAWDQEVRGRRELLAALDQHGEPGDRVMSPDAGAYRYRGGWPGVVTPDDPLATVEKALRLYDIRWLALERDHLVPSLAPILDGRSRPSWLSAPVVEVGQSGEGKGRDEDDRKLAAALYAVCLVPQDDRCDH
jgi:4-amino-4-deoxy-L-arabinose transferase-like glycosyltransferase